MLRSCRLLAVRGSRPVRRRMLLKEAREVVHACLEELKEVFNAAKAPIKQNFPPEVWLSFGIQDKK